MATPLSSFPMKTSLRRGPLRPAKHDPFGAGADQRARRLDLYIARPRRPEHLLVDNLHLIFTGKKDRFSLHVVSLYPREHAARFRRDAHHDINQHGRTTDDSAPAGSVSLR